MQGPRAAMTWLEKETARDDSPFPSPVREGETALEGPMAAMTWLEKETARDDSPFPSPVREGEATLEGPSTAASCFHSPMQVLPSLR
jgi:hypothetical protein